MAMKAYKSYKNVDLPWLKCVPEHWEVARNKNFLSEQKAIVGDNFANYSLLSLTLNGVIIRDVNNGKGKFPASFNTYKIVSPGNMVFCLFDIDETPRTVGLSTHYGMITNAYEVLGVHNINPQYLYYYYLQLDNRKALKPLYHGLRKTISIGTFLQTKLPVPPKEEQDQIVRYLDWQNSRLNKLINAKKKEIALLEEQKQALISQAVTKGLDPNAPLKDSGIDWIGQIPEHWLLCNLKYLCSMRSGKNLTSIQITENGPYPVYGGNGVRGYYSQYNVNSKCLIVGRQGALCGNVHYVNEKIWATDHAVVTQVYNFIHLKFFYYLLTAMNLNRYASQTAAQPGLAVSNILNQKVCFPPINEQRKIAVYLERQCTFIDNLIDNINRIISLLQEYRTRLVADVVTGQIDVRNIAIPNYETVTETIDQPETTEDGISTTEE